jgi:hypothetical protein
MKDAGHFPQLQAPATLVRLARLSRRVSAVTASFE